MRQMPSGILGKALDRSFVQRSLGKDTEKSLAKLKSILEKTDDSKLGLACRMNNLLEVVQFS